MKIYTVNNGQIKEYSMQEFANEYGSCNTEYFIGTLPVEKDEDGDDIFDVNDYGEIDLGFDYEARLEDRRLSLANNGGSIYNSTIYVDYNDRYVIIASDMSGNNELINSFSSLEDTKKEIERLELEEQFEDAERWASNNLPAFYSLEDAKDFIGEDEDEDEDE